MLKCENLCKSYGGISAVSGVNLYIKQGESVGLIGSNGAGKTSLFNLLAGFEKPDKGEIFLIRGGEKTKLNGLPPHARIKFGIGRTFQNLRLFKDMSVHENILAGALGNGQNPDCCLHLLEELGLFPLKDAKAGSLPYGSRKTVEIARSLASGAKLLLLDEPAAGLSETEALYLAGKLKKLRQEKNLTLLLIEHNMDFICGLCDRLYAMDSGRIVAEGRPRSVLHSPAVIDTVFGGAPYVFA
ncbi:MAG: ABC transporter ATP-binding protein [Oscillospiraceae bacterium]|nr:ABC transporter ATP-binding protein [Oscillospiraceae bacterium]